MKNYKSIFMIAAGLMALMAVSCSIDTVGGCCDETDEKVSRNEVFKVAVETQTIFNLTNINGGLQIRGADTDSVIIRVKRTVGSHSEEDAAYYMDQFKVEVTPRTSAIDCETIYPKNVSGREFQADYDVEVPRSMAVQASLVNGGIVIEDIENTVSASCTNGNMNLDGIVGDLNLSLVNGQINADMDLPRDGRAVFSTVNGNILLNVPNHINAQMKIQTVNGTVRVTSLRVEDMVTTKTSISGKLNDGNGSITASTVNGNVTLSGE